MDVIKRLLGKTLQKIKSAVIELSKMLPDKLFVYWYFLLFQRKFLRLKNPESFSEKMQWTKIYGNLERYTDYVDKYEVRTFVEKTIGKEYLIPLIGIWERFEDIPFHELPDKFVMKATHGSGYNFICQNKAKLDKTKLRKSLNAWLNENFYKVSREAQYKMCKPRIICEEYIGDGSGDLKDYKFFCFGGVPNMIQIDSGRFSNHKRDLMDSQWNKLSATLQYPNSGKKIIKPKKFEDMLSIAKKMSKKFPFVRVDLYSVNGRVYFGELTFTPGSGLEMFTPIEKDYHLGELIDLEEFTKQSAY